MALALAGPVLAQTAPEMSPQQAAMERQRAAVEAMRPSLAAQKESVQKQVHGAAADAFYSTPWTNERVLAAPVSFRAPCGPALSRLQLEPAAEKAAQKNHLPPDLVRAVIGRESAWDPCAVSSKGAMGLMQLMPATASGLGVDDPFDPYDNLEAGTRYLKSLLDRYGGDWAKALAGYNAGPARVDAAGGVPNIKETRDYVREILSQIQ